jgi:macrolide transport system ATP-binding/permease protein
MRLVSILRLRLRSLFSHMQVEQELDEELRYHLARQIEEDIAAGMNPEDARRSALRSIAGVEQRKEECRDARGLNLVDNLVQDLRFAGRQLVKSPGFTVTAVLMIGLGMGASVAIFGFVDAALIKPLPYLDADRLVNVTEATAQIPRANLSYPDYLDWKRLNSVFSSMDVHNGRGYMLRTASGTELVSGARVSDGFFRTLGVAPAIGRDFYAGEDLPEAPHTVILSHATWQKRFGARADVIGQSVTLNAIPHTIVGVLPQDFQFAPRGTAELWTTLHPSGSCDLRRSCHNLVGVGRLKDGVAIETARAEMQSIAKQLETQYPDSNRDQGASVVSLSDVIVGDYRPVLLVLLGGAGLLLLIACVNVASLLLVRSESRRRELAVRSALGASQGRLIRQFVTEGVVLVAIGSALGLANAHWAMQLLIRLVPADMMASMPFLQSVGLNVRVVTCAGAIALVATIVCSIAPTLRMSASAARAGMADGERGSAGNTWHRLGFKLVVLELATAMVLLVGAGLLGKSLYRLLHVDLGFEPAHLATLQIAVPRAGYASDEQVVALGKQIVGRIASLPGVESAGIASVLPVSFNGNTDWIRFVGRAYNGEHNEVNQRDVSPLYFKTLRASLVRGRYFTEADGASKPRVVIINQSLARHYFPGEDPIGRKIGDTSLSPASIKEIVGIVADIREGQLDSEIWPAVYYPFNQSPDTSFSLVVRTSQTERSVLPTLGAAIAHIDPDIGTIREATMSDRITDSPMAYLRRSSAWLLGGFAALALLLGIVGLYGVIAYTVSQRTREIGVRLALGAQRGSVCQLVLGEAGRLAGVGIAVGLVCSVAGATLMRNLLFGTPPWDVPTLAAVAAVLGISALLASYIPARRAAAVDPVDALRAE